MGESERELGIETLPHRDDDGLGREREREGENGV